MKDNIFTPKLIDIIIPGIKNAKNANSTQEKYTNDYE